MFHRERAIRIKPEQIEKTAPPKETQYSDYEYRRTVLHSLADDRCRDHDPSWRNAFLTQKTDFLNPITSLPDWSSAAARIKAAIAGHEKVAVFGDFDCDGVCSVTLMLDFLEAAGAKRELLRPFIPNRFEDGYGVTRGALRKCIDLHQPQLLIVVD